MTLAQINIVHSRLIERCKTHYQSALPEIKMALYGELGVLELTIVHPSGSQNRIEKPLKMDDLMNIFKRIGEVYRIELINSRLYSITYTDDLYIVTDGSTGSFGYYKYPADNSNTSKDCICQHLDFGDFVDSTLYILNI